MYLALASPDPSLAACTLVYWTECVDIRTLKVVIVILNFQLIIVQFLMHNLSCVFAWFKIQIKYQRMRSIG